MKITDMTPEQRREYNRDAKRRQRADAKAAGARSVLPSAHDYVMPEQQQNKLTERCVGLQKTIAAELNVEKLTRQDEYVVDAVGSVLFGLENRITQIVHDPEGVLVGGWFPDAAASESIEYVHRAPRLLQSQTFTEHYNKFLNAVENWSHTNEQFSTKEFIREIEGELDGTYVLPPLRELPKSEPPKIKEKPIPSMAEILERGRIELFRRLHPEE